MFLNDRLGLAAKGDMGAVEQLFQRYRHRLNGMASMRLDPRLLKRADPSDVVRRPSTIRFLRA